MGKSRRSAKSDTPQPKAADRAEEAAGEVGPAPAALFPWSKFGGLRAAVSPTAAPDAPGWRGPDPVAEAKPDA